MKAHSKRIKKSSKKSLKKSSKKTSKKSSRGGSKENPIVYNNIKKLHDYLKEKKLFYFWVFIDDKSFKKKINDKTLKELESMIKNDLDKYKDKRIAEISISTFHDEPDSWPRKEGIWANAKITIYKPQKDGKLKSTGGTMVAWKEQDFKVSKVTFKLLERLTKLSADKKYSCVRTLGCPLSYVVEKIKELKIKIDDVLDPLES